jgi:hypothetical protein
MARFGREIIYRMDSLVEQLEITLGPGTADLCMRVGMHSGPVTAGVLRGEKSRFQLFGDTVNTAARMESTGEQRKIQISLSTADLLQAANKGQWLTPREEVVVAKGKGELQTYWVKTRSRNHNTSEHASSSDHFSEDIEQAKLAAPSGARERRTGQSVLIEDRESSFRQSGDADLVKSKTLNHKSLMQDARLFESSSVGLQREKSFKKIPSAKGRQARIIEWQVDLLTGILKKIVAQRSLRTANSESRSVPEWNGSEKHPKDEVADTIIFPKLDPSFAAADALAGNVELDVEVAAQVRDFLTNIASMYRSNGFHNFEHACHATMSANKLLNRIVKAELRSAAEPAEDSATLEYTARITSNPLVHFAVVISALIHDVDHNGVANMQLIQEKAHIAASYKNRSVAEQHSFDVAWELLMDPCYDKLQSCIFADQTELDLFRQIVINGVMATDIFDKDGATCRTGRWERAFGTSANKPVGEELHNLRATVIIETAVQASAVIHTMQHWTIYKTWNERLYEEMVSAYENGRADKEPTLGWYDGEMSFFDDYIIPLAGKMLDSKAFGVVGGECLNNAIENCVQWVSEGQEIVKNMASRHSKAGVPAELLTAGASMVWNGFGSSSDSDSSSSASDDKADEDSDSDDSD